MCYCGSNETYENCCGVYHSEIGYPKTALKLMKSRYSAFAAKKIEYLVDTTHPDLDAVYDDLDAWAKATEWKKLEIIECTSGRVSDEFGEVEFKATYSTESTKLNVHHEKSQFKKVDGKWKYYSGELNPKSKTTSFVGRNDPCPCGSGKKHKKCCG